MESEEEEEEAGPLTSIPEGFRQALRECLLDGYLEVSGQGSR
jgi:hypothetical protein